MRITTIGSGTAAPHPSRVCSAHLVEVGGLRILLDCGSGAVFRMRNVGIDWMNITHLCISHFHADHISDIPTLLFGWRYGAIPWRQAPVQIIGPSGFVALFDKFDALYNNELRTLGYPLTLTEMQPEETISLAANVSVTACKVPHTVESVAYSINTGRKRVVYTGDTAFDPALAEWARECDLLLAECSLPQGMAIPTHMTPEQCGELAALAKPKVLALTHFYPPLDSVDVADIVGKRYDGPIHLTYDGWTFEIED